MKKMYLTLAIITILITMMVSLTGCIDQYVLMSIGDDALIQKSQESNEKLKLANAKETLTLALHEIKIDSYINGGINSVTLNDINNKLTGAYSLCDSRNAKKNPSNINAKVTDGMTIYITDLEDEQGRIFEAELEETTTGINIKSFNLYY